MATRRRRFRPAPGAANAALLRGRAAHRPDASTTPAASAWSAPSTASRAARWCSRHRRAEGRLAPRRRRRRRQDRRRRRHPGRAAAGLLRRAGGAHRPRLRPGRIAVGMVFLPSTDLGAQERCRAHRRDARSCAAGFYIYGWRQVPIDTALHRREGQRHPARDRADPALARAARTTRPGARPVPLPPAHREGGHRGADPGPLHLLAVRRSLIYKGMFLAEHMTDSTRTCATRASSRRSPSSTSATRPTPSRMAAGPAVPDAGPQRRDQHAQGQRQLDEEPRDAARRTRCSTTTRTTSSR